jgi:hypothetical protein
MYCTVPLRPPFLLQPSLSDKLVRSSFQGPRHRSPYANLPHRPYLKLHRWPLKTASLIQKLAWGATTWSIRHASKRLLNQPHLPALASPFSGFSTGISGVKLGSLGLGVPDFLVPYREGAMGRTKEKQAAIFSGVANPKLEGKKAESRGSLHYNCYVQVSNGRRTDVLQVTSSVWFCVLLPRLFQYLPSSIKSHQSHQRDYHAAPSLLVRLLFNNRDAQFTALEPCPLNSSGAGHRDGHRRYWTKRPPLF